MATADRKDPYRAFNFKLEIDGITRAGFRECAGLDAGTDPVDYREGNEKGNIARKLTGKGGLLVPPDGSLRSPAGRLHYPGGSAPCLRHRDCIGRRNHV